MKVKELIKMLEGKENYNIDVNYFNEDFDVEIDDETETISLILNEDEDDLFDDDEEDYNEEDTLYDYLYSFSKDELCEISKKLEIDNENLEDLDEDNLIDLILINNEDDIKEACESLSGYTYDDFQCDNAWRHSNYEEKDIGDWNVDDHMAAWYDHMMEK